MENRGNAAILYSFLLGPSAFCLLAGAIGLFCSVLFWPSSEKDGIAAGRLGFFMAAMLFGYGLLSLLVAFLLAGRSERTWIWSSLFLWGLVAGIMVIPTALLFGPTSGFHHMLGFGPFPFCYMVWNGEDPEKGSFQIVDGYEVGFDPSRFGVLLVIWFVIISIAIWGVRPTRNKVW
jgi:hypothetical protein